jgi:aryl-phospho-beta-D-glucosidase BglC (GH1 family)
VAQFAAQQNLTAQLRSAIQTHRASWVTEADFAFMASIGVNSVRLPVGYWVLAETQARLGIC